LSYSLLIKDLL